MYNKEKFKIAFKQLGLHIQDLRLKRNMSIEDLSQKTGIRKEYLNKIEKGTAYGVLVLKHLVKIANAFNIKLYELLVGRLW